MCVYLCTDVCVCALEFILVPNCFSIYIYTCCACNFYFHLSSSNFNFCQKVRNTSFYDRELGCDFFFLSTQLALSVSKSLLCNFRRIISWRYCYGFCALKLLTSITILYNSKSFIYPIVFIEFNYFNISVLKELS